MSVAEWPTHHPDPAVRERTQRQWRALHVELDRLVEGLKQQGAERIILFGSMAKGRANPRSDIDLLAVIPTSLPFVERMAHFYRLLQPRNADLLIYTPEEFAAGLGMTQTALAEGKVVYERPSG